jgi:H+/Cl- antiporter ClcA
MGVSHADRLSDFNRDKRILVTSLLAVVIGIISAFVAVGLVWLINFFTNLCFFGRISGDAALPQDSHFGPMMVLIPALGGLIIGLMARYGSDKIRGHGIPEALEAILIGRSKMSPKVAVLKPLSSAISIGTGGPFGAEGPIIMTGGAFGSLFAQLFHLTAAERKTLLVAGAAGGMAAIFATPIAAVLLAVELLLFEWKPRSVIPVAIAASIAGALRVSFLGQGPIFAIPPHPTMTGAELGIAAVVGLVAGLCSGILTTMVYAAEDFFPKIKIHWMWWPTLGGLAVGIGGLIDPRTLGVGYGVIHQLLQGTITGGDAFKLLADKAIIWSVALGSGTSGGVLAPLLIIGGGIGAVEAQFIPLGDSGLWALLSMAAMMGGTMRSPLTGIIFMLELTHDLNALPALLIASVAAYAVTVGLLRRSILTEKVARHGHHIMREYIVDPLEMVKVGEVMDQSVATVRSGMSVAELSEKIARHDPELSRRHALPIVNDNDELVGIITRSDILRALQDEPSTSMTVLEAGQADVIVTFPDEMLRYAVDSMLKNDIGRLPVVSRENPKTICGLLGRSSLMLARAQMNELEHSKESTWSRAKNGKQPVEMS